MQLVVVFRVLPTAGLAEPPARCLGAGIGCALLPRRCPVVSTCLPLPLVVNEGPPPFLKFVRGWTVARNVTAAVSGTCGDRFTYHNALPGRVVDIPSSYDTTWSRAICGGVCVVDDAQGSEITSPWRNMTVLIRRRPPSLPAGTPCPRRQFRPGERRGAVLLRARPRVARATTPPTGYWRICWGSLPAFFIVLLVWFDLLVCLV